MEEEEEEDLKPDRLEEFMDMAKPHLSLPPPPPPLLLLPPPAPAPLPPPPCEPDNESGGKKNSPGEMRNSTAAVQQSEWSPAAVVALLTKYGEKFARGRGYLRVADWQEVAISANSQIADPRACKTLKQCRDKVDSLKRRYKLEKSKSRNRPASSSSSSVPWPYFRFLDDMMVQTPAKLARIPGGVDAGVRLPFSHASHPDRNADGKGKSPLHGSDSESDPETDTDTNSNTDTDNGFSTPSCSNKRETPIQDNPPPTHRNKRHRMSNPNPNPNPNPNSNPNPNPNPDPDPDPDPNLAHSVIGFANVLAHIEMTKAEILTRIKLDLTKLKRRRRRKWRGSSSISSESD